MTLPIIIVGAGQGGLQVAESLRKEKYDGEILLIGDEPHAPYNRPPLSKSFLLSETTVEQLTIRNPQALAKKRITLITGTRVAAINRTAHTIVFADGTERGYAKLVIATGSRARNLGEHGAGLAGMHRLRSLNDTLAIQKDIEAARRIVVIGGGFIGLEMAAVARKMGKDVVVFEASERLMGRVVAPPISDYYADLHTRHGVDVRLNARLSGFDESNDRVRAVTLENGEIIPTDMVVLGVGVLANAELAEAAGLECDGGVIVDQNACTTDPDIFAIGDCTATRMEDGTLRRLESVQNAVEMAKAAAAAVMGADKPFTAAPWFWSDQYDIKLQMVGLSQGHDTFLMHGKIEDDAFCVFYFKDDALIAVDSVNAPREHMAGRKLLNQQHGVCTKEHLKQMLG